MFAHPASEFVIDFLGGVNVWHGRIENGSARIGDLQLPEGALFISLLRVGHAMIPNSETVFERGDVVVALVPAEMESLLREFVA